MEKLELKHLAPYLPYNMKFHLPLYSERYDSIMENEPFLLALPFMREEEKEKCLNKYVKMYLYQDQPEIMYESGEVFLGNMKSSLGFDLDDVFLHETMIILRPLSDLTKEIEHNGEKFVPLNKIQDIRGRKWVYFEEEDEYCELFYFTDHNSNTYYNVREFPFEVLSLLFEWHFDVFNLHSKNLCIYFDELK